MTAWPTIRNPQSAIRNPQSKGVAMIDFINPSELGPRPRPFSRATKAGGFVFVSGHSAPHDPANGKPRGETAQEQARGSLETLKAILEAAGRSFDRIVWVSMVRSEG